VHRQDTAVRREPHGAAFAPAEPLHQARSVDLVTMRLVLRQHLEELRLRGVDERVLRPIEDELFSYGETIDQLTEGLHRR
jgi:hypothetical protein